MTNDEVTWGKQLRKFRKRMGYSQEELADELSKLELGLVISSTDISRYETDAERVPKNRTRHIELISGLLKLGGILTIEEANEWVDLGGQGYLKPNEVTEINSNLVKTKDPLPQQLVQVQLGKDFSEASIKFESRSPELEILLEKVKKYYTNDFLRNSIYTGGSLLNLSKETRNDAVVHSLGKPIFNPLPPDKKIGDIFSEGVDHALLILGEPGSGKTTTLLELARDLVAKAELDKSSHQPIPIILNLSQWAINFTEKDNKQQIFKDWLVKRICVDYGNFPKDDIRIGLEKKQFILLLDALDEIKPEYQESCIEAINEFEFGITGIVVCCRDEVYFNQPARLRFNKSAVYLQSLTFEQIDNYLSVAGSDLEALHIVIKNNEELHKLAQSPLMLDVMCRTYSGASRELILSQIDATMEKLPNHIFNTYIQRMFMLKAQENKPYPDEQTKSWLAWLAQQMARHNQNIFLLEQIQPSWLLARRWRLNYIFCSRLIGGILVGMSMSLIMGTWSDGLIFGFAGGLTVALVDVIRFEFLNKSVGHRNRPNLGWLLNLGSNVLIVWLIVDLVDSLISKLFLTDTRVLNLSLAWSLAFGFIFGIRGSWRSLTNDIQIVEGLNWSIRRALIGGLYGVLIGAITTGPPTALIFTYDVALQTWMLGMADWLKFISPDYLRVMLAGGLLFGTTIGGPVGAVFYGGPISKVLDSQFRQREGSREGGKKNRLNRGIWLSLTSAIYNGMGFGVISGLIFVLILILMSGDIEILSYSVFNGLCIGTLAALWYGGLDVIKHFILRIILIWQGYTPDRFDKFLEYAVQLIFLNKIGDGYEFKYHPHLRDHFAQSQTIAKNPAWKQFSLKQSLAQIFGRSQRQISSIFIITMSTILLVILLPVLVFKPTDNTLADTYFREINSYIADNEICVLPGDVVTVEANGSIKVGYLLGNVKPEGRNAGFLGFPLGDTFDIEPAFPHGSLMCRISGDDKWRRCAMREFSGFNLLLFGEPRKAVFTASSSGCLEFDVNDNEKANNSGSFHVIIRIKRGL